MIEPKLYMNDHWMIPYKVVNFYVDQKCKMAATTGLIFYIGHYGKMNNRVFLDHKLENSNHRRKILNDLMEKCKKRYSQEAQN